MKRIHLYFYQAIGAGFVLSSLYSGLCVADTSTLRISRDLYTGQIVVTDANTLVLKYNYQLVCPPPGLIESVTPGNRRYARARSNYIHPLYGPHGEVLTHDWSVDHPHHRGLYWAWPEVDWRGERGDLHALQRVWARPTGTVSFKHKATYAQMRAENRWFWEDETPIVREVATIRVHQAGEHGRYIDLIYSFEALEDNVTLARRGTKAYGGLNIRLSPIKDMQLRHHADPAGTHPRMAWSLSQGIRQGGTQPVGFAVLEKATNPDYPGDYIQYPNLPWFQPTFPRSATRYGLEKGRPLMLQYRLWIRSGTLPTEAECRRHWTLYQNEKGCKFDFTQ